jgi:hypothetical protein
MVLRNPLLVFTAAALGFATAVQAPRAAEPLQPQAQPLQPFVGQWKLNLAKTHMGIGGPDVATPNRAPTFTWIFTPIASGLRMDVYAEYPQPAPTRTLLVNADGKVHPCLGTASCLPSGGDPRQQSYAYHEVDDHLISRLFYLDGKIIEYDTYTVSEDGRTLVITAWHAPTPQFQNVQVFDKQP